MHSQRKVDPDAFSNIEQEEACDSLGWGVVDGSADEKSDLPFTVPVFRSLQVDPFMSSDLPIGKPDFLTMGSSEMVDFDSEDEMDNSNGSSSDSSFMSPSRQAKFWRPAVPIQEDYLKPAPDDPGDESTDHEDIDDHQQQLEQNFDFEVEAGLEGLDLLEDELPPNPPVLERQNAVFYGRFYPEDYH